MAVDPIALATNGQAGNPTATGDPTAQDTTAFDQAIGKAIITGGIMVASNIISKMQSDMQEQASDLQGE